MVFILCAGPYIPYLVLVSAYTSIGSGKPIAAVFFTQEGGTHLVWTGWVISSLEWMGGRMISNYCRGGVCACVCVWLIYYVYKYAESYYGESIIISRANCEVKFGWVYMLTLLDTLIIAETRMTRHWGYYWRCKLKNNPSPLAKHWYKHFLNKCLLLMSPIQDVHMQHTCACPSWMGDITFLRKTLIA